VGAPIGQRLRTCAVLLDVRASLGWLGHVVGWQLSDCHVWTAASTPHSARQPDTLCSAAENAHDPCIRAILDVSRSLRRGAISHVGPARSVVSPDVLAAFRNW